MYENMLQNAPNGTIPKKFLGEACPRTPLANVCYATRRISLHGMPLAQPSKKLAPLGRSCIRPRTTTKKFI